MPKLSVYKVAFQFDLLLNILYTGLATIPDTIRPSKMHRMVGMDVLSDGKVFVSFLPFHKEVLIENVDSFTFIY